MTVIWNDFQNNENGLSVRNKINNFNGQIANLTAVFDATDTQVGTNTTNIATNTADITALDTRVTTVEADVATLQGGYHNVGFVDYNDATTATTPISVPSGSVYVDITNDGAGPYTLKTYLPSGVTDVWNTTTNRFDWSELALGDMVDIRLDLEVTTTAPTQEVDVVLEMATASGAPYAIPFATNFYKTAGTYKINRYNGVYIGDTNTLTGGARFRIKSDAAATVKVNGYYVRIIAK